MEHDAQPHQGYQHQLVKKEMGDHGKTPSSRWRNEGILPGFQAVGMSRRLEVHIWTPCAVKGHSNGKHTSEQMQPYIRPLGEDIRGLRALMKSALPLLITTAASWALYLVRVGGSRSDRLCHQLDPTSHHA